MYSVEILIKVVEKSYSSCKNKWLFHMVLSCNTMYIYIYIYVSAYEIWICGSDVKKDSTNGIVLADGGLVRCEIENWSTWIPGYGNSYSSRGNIGRRQTVISCDNELKCKKG